MRRIDNEKDPELLHKAMRLLEAENKRLSNLVAKLLREIAMLKGEGEKGAQLRLAQLERQLATLQKKLFGISSEKRTLPESSSGKDEKKPKTGHGPREQPKLPIHEVIHDLDNADRACPSCGGSLEVWEGQFEESEEVDVVTREFRIVKHKRRKYRCKCYGCIETAPGPQKLFDGARYSIDFAVEVAINKYLDHMPLERQVRSMARDGLIVDSQTLWDQIFTSAMMLEPAYERLLIHIWSHPVIGGDETPWRLMGKYGNPEGGSKRCYAWSAVAPKAAYYKILHSRSTEACEEVFGGYQGMVMVDGYNAYEALAKRSGKFRLLHCWAHVRRKFIEIESSFPKPVAEVLDRIRKLYAIEKKCPHGPEYDEQRRALRDTESRPIVEEIRAWALSTIVTPESGLAMAIRYMLGLWQGLTRFLDEPRAPLDNNATERMLRNIVLGRKNHYGSRSERGLKAAAILYSLIDTAVLEGIDPRQYLGIAIRAARRKEQVPLPHEVAASLGLNRDDQLVED